MNGSKLQTISKNAFKGDKKLKNISLKKVKSLKKVEKAAFKGVSKKVTVKSAEEQKESLQQAAGKRRHCGRQSKIIKHSIEGFRQT